MDPVGEPSADPCERLKAELTLLVRGNPVTEGMKCGTQPADIRLPTVDEHCLRAGHSTDVLRGLTASFISGLTAARDFMDENELIREILNALRIPGPQTILRVEPQAERTVDTARVIHRSHEPVPEVGLWAFV